MIRHLIMHTGAASALMAAASDASGGTSVQLVINDAEIPRFTAAGRLVEPGEVFDASELHTDDFIAKSTPVGTLSDDQLLAVLAQRGLITNPQAPEGEPGAAPVAPMADMVALEEADELRKRQIEAADGNIQRASDVLTAQAPSEADAEAARADAEARRRGELGAAGAGAGAAGDAAAEAEKRQRDEAAALTAREASNANLDLDGDLKPGGSMTKAAIAAELTDLKVEFDPKGKRDELAAILFAERRKGSSDPAQS